MSNKGVAMRAVIQRVSSAGVVVQGASIGAIGSGLMILLGVFKTDEKLDAELLAEKDRQTSYFFRRKWKDEPERLGCRRRSLGRF